jgi:hypothetical protein
MVAQEVLLRTVTNQLLCLSSYRSFRTDFLHFRLGIGPVEVRAVNDFILRKLCRGGIIGI